jgi:hypothetical protein
MSTSPYRSDRAKAWRNMTIATINDGVFDLIGNGPERLQGGASNEP